MKEKAPLLLADIMSALFIILFVYAAISKFTDFQKFEVELGKSPVLSPFSKVLVWLVPIIEIGISLILALKQFQLIGFYLAFSMMVLFSAYIVTILNFSEYIPCSCGGILENMSWKQHMVFNCFFVLLGVIAVLIYPLNKESIAIVRGSRKP